MKVLILTYYWPPAGGPGVQRWLKFVKYLEMYGITPIVYIPKNPTYPLQDASLTTEVSEQLTILTHTIFEPYRFAQLFAKKETKTISKGIIAKTQKQSWIQRILLFIRGNFFIPDARKFWVKPSVHYLSAYLKDHPVDAVITTGPPHSVHLIGQQLKTKHQLPWIADFRDPWTTIGYHDQLKLTKTSQKKHLVLEQSVLDSADHILVTSRTTKTQFQEKTKTPITTITNGYDLEAVPETPLDTDFTLSHIGSLLSERNPKQLWQALYELTVEEKTFAAHFRLRLVGAVSAAVLESIEKSGLKAFVDRISYVPHEEAVRLQRSSHVLLLIEIDSPETRCIVPGKVFEYMASQRPMIAVGPKDADVAQLIEETQSGYFFEYHEKERMKHQILTYFRAFQAKKNSSTTQGIEKYTRKALTGALAKVVQNVVQSVVY